MTSIVQLYSLSQIMPAIWSKAVTTASVVGKITGYGLAVGGSAATTASSLFLALAVTWYVVQKEKRGDSSHRELWEFKDKAFFIGSLGAVVTSVAGAILGFQATGYGIALTAAICAVTIPALLLYRAWQIPRAPQNATETSFETPTWKDRLIALLPSTGVLRNISLAAASMIVSLSVANFANTFFALGLFL